MPPTARSPVACPPVRPPPATGPFLQPARLRAPQTSLAAPPRVLGFAQPKSMRWCMAARMAATMPDGQASWGWLDERLLAPIGGHGAASCPSPPCVKGGRLGAVWLRGSPANNNGRETIPVAISTSTPVHRHPQPPAPGGLSRLSRVLPSVARPPLARGHAGRPALAAHCAQRRFRRAPNVWPARMTMSLPISLRA